MAAGATMLATLAGLAGFFAAFREDAFGLLRCPTGVGLVNVAAANLLLARCRRQHTLEESSALRNLPVEHRPIARLDDTLGES